MNTTGLISRWMHFWAIVLCAVSLPFVFSMTVLAQTPPSTDGENEPLVIGVYTWAPYSGYDLPGHGFLTEVIQVAMTRAGFATVVKKVPWARALKESLRGKIDILPGIWYQEERVEGIAYGPVLAVNRLVLMSRTNGTKKIETLDDLDGQIVGVAQDYAYPKAFVEAQNFKRDLSKNLDLSLIHI